MRVLTGVEYPAARVTPRRFAPRGSAFNSRRPSSSRPTRPTTLTLAPSAAAFAAALPAPPGTMVVLSYLRIRTGASRDMRETRPEMN